MIIRIKYPYHGSHNDNLDYADIVYVVSSSCGLGQDLAKISLVWDVVYRANINVSLRGNESVLEDSKYVIIDMLLDCLFL